MNATAALPRPLTRIGSPRRLRRRAQRPSTRALVAFCALALLAGLRFATLLAHPPLVRVLMIVAASAAGGAALSCTRSLPCRRALATSGRAMIALLMVYLALRAAGAPADLLWPWRWTRFAHQLGRGLAAFDGLWPYRGRLPQAREAVMLAVSVASVSAAILLFWPGAWQAPARRALALALLLTLYLIAATNQSQVGWQFQGVLLLALLSLWAWAWQSQAMHLGPAATWMLVGGVLALLGAGALRSGTPLLDYDALNPFSTPSRATSFDWNQRYGPLPWSLSAATMVSVSSPAAHLWRATTLERFDGVGFERSQTQPPDPGESTDVALHPRWVTHASFTVRGLSSEQLLSPGQLISATIASDRAPRVDSIAADGTVSVSGGKPSNGSSYMVSAYVPQPSVLEMRTAPRTLPAADVPYTELELPATERGAARSLVSATNPADVARIEASPYARVYRLARRLGSAAPSSYDVVARIEAFLRHGFAYDPDPPPSSYPLVSFLFAQRVGYCQQFSGAMTLLLRMDGIPARVAAGFASGSRNPATGRYEVSARDAHAWVEVLFAGIGWVAFDPTPARRAGSNVRRPLAGEADAAKLLKLRALSSGSLGGHRIARDAAHSSGPHDTGLSVGTVAALALTIALALLVGAVWWAKTSRIERALAGDADGAVRELSRALPKAGVQLAAGATLAELESRLQRTHGPEASRYVRLVRERRYAPDADPQLPTTRDRRLMRQALCAHRGPLAWWRVLLALPPAVWRPRGRDRPSHPSRLRDPSS